MDSSSFDSLKDPLFTHLSKKSGKWLRYEGSEKALHALSDLLEQWIIGLGSREGGSSSELCVHLLNILLVTVHRMPKDDAKDEKTARVRWFDEWTEQPIDWNTVWTLEVISESR